MANGDFFDTFLRNASNYNGGEPEYYEDTHDANGKYVGNSRGNVGGYVPPQQPPLFAPQQPPAQPSYVPPQNSGYTPPPDRKSVV